MTRKLRVIAICLILNMVLNLCGPGQAFATFIEQPPAKVAFSDKDVERLNMLLDASGKHDEVCTWLFKKLAFQTRQNDLNSVHMLLAAYTFTGPEDAKVPATMTAECWNALWAYKDSRKPGKRFTKVAWKLSNNIYLKPVDVAFSVENLLRIAGRPIYRDYVYLAGLGPPDTAPSEQNRVYHRDSLCRLVGEDAVAALEAELREEQNRIEANNRGERTQTISPQDVQQKNSKPTDAVSN